MALESAEEEAATQAQVADLQRQVAELSAQITELSGLTKESPDTR